MSALDRAALMLSMIPRRPRGVAVAEIVERLKASGHGAHQRSVQRDLVTLARALPLLVDRTNKPYRWGWSCAVSCPWVRR